MKRLTRISVALALVAVAIRVRNALRYPADWGFDASFNWRYIYRLTQDWTLPPPQAGWSTSDPPLFYYVSAVVMRGLAALGARDAAVFVLPLLSTLEGLGVVALAVALVRRAAPADSLRVALAGLLLLFLPAHLHMSAMVNEGMLLALLTSAAVYGLALRDTRARPATRSPMPPRVGLWSGLALLTKLSGALAILTGVATYAAGWTARGSALARRRPASPCSDSSRSPSAAGSTRARSSRPGRSSPSPWGPIPACSSCRPASARWPISCACRSRPSATHSS